MYVVCACVCVCVCLCMCLCVWVFIAENSCRKKTLHLIQVNPKFVFRWDLEQQRKIYEARLFNRRVFSSIQAHHLKFQPGDLSQSSVRELILNFSQVTYLNLKSDCMSSFSHVICQVLVRWLISNFRLVATLSKSLVSYLSYLKFYSGDFSSFSQVSYHKF